MRPLSPSDLHQLVALYDGAGVRALALMGSHARGGAGRFSDVDLLRVLADGVAVSSGSFLVSDRLVVVGDATLAELEARLADPEQAVNVVAGLRAGRPLVDRDGCLAVLQGRARAFRWDAAMQARADAWASQQLVGWCEEAHKGLEGLRRGDEGRLLNARFGLSWGLARVMIVQRGLLLDGDNAFWAALSAEMGAESEWMRLCRGAFGVDGASLRAQVKSGLRLYMVTAGLLHGRLRPADVPLIAHTVEIIASELGE